MNALPKGRILAHIHRGPPLRSAVVLEEANTHSDTLEATVTHDTVTLQHIVDFDDARAPGLDTLCWPADRHADVVVMLALLRPELVAGIVARLGEVRG